MLTKKVPLSDNKLSHLFSVRNSCLVVMKMDRLISGVSLIKDKLSDII